VPPTSLPIAGREKRDRRLREKTQPAFLFPWEKDPQKTIDRPAPCEPEIQARGGEDIPAKKERGGGNRRGPRSGREEKVPLWLLLDKGIHRYPSALVPAFSRKRAGA